MTMADLALRYRPVFRAPLTLILIGVGSFGLSFGALAASNSCPVDGCQVEIVSVEQAANAEYTLTLSANFDPLLAKNHIHVWWGENWEVTQVTANAMTVYHNAQGEYHPIDDYPTYTTTGVVSASRRGTAITLCVTAADRNHNILSPELYHCQPIPLTESQ